jgi:hypothetical protein
MGSGVAELAQASVIHLRNPGSNLGIAGKYFLIVFVPHMYFLALFVNIHIDQ